MDGCGSSEASLSIYRRYFAFTANGIGNKVVHVLGAEWYGPSDLCVPKAGFTSLLEAAGITKSPSEQLGDFPLVIGDPEGIRTPDLHRDRVAC